MPVRPTAAMLHAGRMSANPNDFAVVAMLGLLGLRILEASGSDIESLDEVHGHRVLRVRGHANYILAAFMASAT